MIKLFKTGLTKIALISLLMIILVPSCYEVKAATGLGITPSHIELTNLLKGESYYRSIRIFNPRNGTVTVNLSAFGDIASWVKFYKKDDLNNSITNVTIEGDKEEIIVEFDVPKDIANGIYEGYIFAETIPNRTNTNASVGSVKLRLPVHISASVTGTQILNGSITNINIKDVEEGYPLPISIDFINTGNVKAKPLIKIFITRSGWPIANITYSKDVINVDSAGTITIEWDTSNREPGTYEARVLVLLGEKMLIDKNLSFNILPRGTLTRKGELINVSYDGDLSVGNIIKILADFRNTGEIEMEARFVGEVYRDNKLIEVLESDNILIPAGDTFRFITYLKLDRGGKYTISGYVIYDVNTTSKKMLTFEVRNSLGSHMLFAYIGVILISVSIFHLISRRRS